MFEVPFFIDTAALAPPGRTQLSEADFLTAFDSARNSIHDVAREAYSRGCRTSYTLTAADFITIERDDTLQTTALEIEDGRIVAVYAVRNPDKLKHMADTLH